MKVTSCNDCPLAHTSYIDGEEYCRHPDMPGQRSVEGRIFPTPEWCPLKKAPITIELETV